MTEEKTIVKGKVTPIVSLKGEMTLCVRNRPPPRQIIIKEAIAVVENSRKSKDNNNDEEKI